ncbi:WxL protein peptidoglycan domain-containing protein [Streptomyces sp. NPDC058653]|uniref:WxL protein peptidoglycan domain-containing protein n=1 Tax=Streptomyces sp. NPDC058653 TaxID=3346576 RepID=UPI0036516997
MPTPVTRRRNGVAASLRTALLPAGAPRAGTPRAVARRIAARRTALRRTVAALPLLMAFAIAGLGAGPARAADGDVTWTVRTAANGYGDDRSSYSYTVNPGGQVKDAMVVANRSDSPLELTVYAADGYTTGTGQLDLLTKDKKSVGIGVWTHAARDSVLIKPGKTAEVPFTVEVPANATPGDYVGGVLTSLKQADDAAGINVDRRLGIRVKLRVSGELKPRLAVEDLRVDYDGSLVPFAKGDATVTYTIHNTGNALLSARQSVSVSGPFGRLRAEAGDIAPPPDLLPDETWKMKVPVHGVTPGFGLTATATLTPLLIDASGSTTALKPVEATAHGWAVPWTLLLIVVVLVAALVGAFLLRRRARARRKEREDARVLNAVEEALREKERSGQS